MNTIAWVVGARGLLGSAIAAEIGRRDGCTLHSAEPLPWGDPRALEAAIGSTLNGFMASAAASRSTWVIVWAAGSAVTSTTQEVLDSELADLKGFVARIRPPAGLRGAIFYASSAGGVYGGSSGPPFTEATPALPISPYGRFKLRAESVIKEAAQRGGYSSLIGRISNLYGPGQRLDKMQGLISQVAKAEFSTAPASIFVPLETFRDYLYVTDCAALVCDALEELDRQAYPAQVTKILASGQPATIAELLGHFRAISKVRPHVMMGSSAQAALQSIDLRLNSIVWPHLDARNNVPLPVGIHSTMQSVLYELLEDPQPISARSPSTRPRLG